jgi:hypothetical protein
VMVEKINVKNSRDLRVFSTPEKENVYYVRGFLC